MKAGYKTTKNSRGVISRKNRNVVPHKRPDEITVSYQLAELTLEDVKHRLNEAFDVLFEQVIKNRDITGGLTPEIGDKQMIYN